MRWLDIIYIVLTIIAMILLIKINILHRTANEICQGMTEWLENYYISLIGGWQA